MFSLKLFSPTIKELADRYAAGPSLPYQSRYRAKTIAKHLGQIRISKLTPADLRAFMKARGHLSPQSITHEFNTLKAIIRVARQEWGLDIPDHKATFGLIAMPTIDSARDRRLERGEWDALWSEANEMLRLSMVLAVETSMRREEMCAVQKEWIDLDRRVIKLPKEVTKTRKGRDVPLSIPAVEALRPYATGAGSLLGWTPNAHRLCWHRTRNRAAKTAHTLHDFHWHDFRHEAISRLAAKGWLPAKLQVVSGHADWRMLQRYVNLRPEDVFSDMDK